MAAYEDELVDRKSQACSNNLQGIVNLNVIMVDVDAASSSWSAIHGHRINQKKDSMRQMLALDPYLPTACQPVVSTVRRVKFASYLLSD